MQRVDILNIDPRVLIVQIGGFVLLLVVFKVFLFKPIAAILETRQSEIEGRYKEAESQREAAEQLRAEYEKHLASIDEEMRAKITEALKEGQAMRDEIVANSRARAEEILSKAYEEIGREKEKALAELKSTVAGLAVEVAGRLIREELDDARHRELIAAFIDDLSSTHSSAGKAQTQDGMSR